MILLRRELLFLEIGFFLATGSLSAWEIEQFDAHLRVQSDGVLAVQETIQVDFQGEARRGIYRDIPLKTQDRFGIQRSIRLTFLGATDEEGRPWKARLTREGVYRRIRLGDPEVTFTGRKTFVLNYRVERILRSFPEHDELYWNVTGNGWAVPIRQTIARVELPGVPPLDKWFWVAYTGPYGSRESDAEIRLETPNSLRFQVLHPLRPFEGLTIAVGWPPGMVSMPGFSKKLKWFFQDNWFFGIPLLAFLLMWGIWSRFGKDLKPGSVVAAYEPPEGMTPAEVGTLVDDRVDLKDITATIVDLARRGFLSIEQLTHKEYLFAKNLIVKPEAVAGLKSYEQEILGGLFSTGNTVRLSDLENEFYQHLDKIRAGVYDQLVQEQCWWGNPHWIRTIWGGVAVAFFFLGFVLIFLKEELSLALFVSLMGTAVVVVCFAPFMPRKSWKGVRLSEQIRGLQEFLQRTDQDRIQRESDPAVLFERLLPYAMALGVAAQWARAFEGIYQIQPTWYQSYDGSSFTPSDFTQRINAASSQMGTVLTSTPRSSDGSGFSGGSSGGGGGGGGGGSW